MLLNQSNSLRSTVIRKRNERINLWGRWAWKICLPLKNQKIVGCLRCTRAVLPIMVLRSAMRHSMKRNANNGVWRHNYVQLRNITFLTGHALFTHSHRSIPHISKSIIDCCNNFKEISQIELIYLLESNAFSGPETIR